MRRQWATEGSLTLAAGWTGGVQNHCVELCQADLRTSAVRYFIITPESGLTVFHHIQSSTAAMWMAA
jgi:hypothetical protein